VLGLNGAHCVGYNADKLGIAPVSRHGGLLLQRHADRMGIAAAGHRFESLVYSSEAYAELIRLISAVAELLEKEKVCTSAESRPKALRLLVEEGFLSDIAYEFVSRFGGRMDD
jgi:hypothetical protein